MEFNNQTLDKRCMSTVQLLIDIESLSHTDYMTGTLNSGIPYLIEARPSDPPSLLMHLGFWVSQGFCTLLGKP